MGLFGKLVKLTVETVVEAPVAIVKDVVTFGRLNEYEKNDIYTEEKIKEIGKTWKDIKRELDK